MARKIINLKGFVSMAGLLAMLSGTAVGQSFNIELGTGAGVGSSPVPATFAACGQPGHWNEVQSGSPSGILLRDLGNVLRPVIMTRPTTQNAVVPATNADTGDFRNLMADGIPVNPATNVDEYSFSGLESGRYLVYVYFANATSGVDAAIDATGFIGQSLQVEGGGNPNKFSAGGNYSVTSAEVAANGQLLVRVFRQNGGQANVAGMQLAKLNGGRKLVYVDDSATGDNSGTSWANAMSTLIEPASMLEAMYFFETASTDNTVPFELWVAGGTYFATRFTTPLFTDRDDTLTIYDGTRILGGFSGTEAAPAQRQFGPGSETVISGAIGTPSAADNTMTIMTMEDCGPTTLLEHVTVRGGYDDAAGNGFAAGRGAGLTIIGDGTDFGDSGPRLTSVTFRDNQARREGGAVWAYLADPFFTDCEFLANNAGNPGGNPDADGGAYFGDNTDPTFLGCDFIGNTARDTGGAVSIDGNGGTSRFFNTRFLGNEGFRSTLHLTMAAAELANTLVAGNESAFNSAAIFAQGEGADIELANCTVAFNSSLSDSAGLVLVDGADASVFNSIFSGNSGSLAPAPGLAGIAQIATRTSLPGVQSFVAFAFSSVQNGTQMQVPFNTAAFDNNTEDPDFADISGPDNIFGNGDDDYRPLPDSPMVDTGDISFAAADLFDLDNDGVVFEEIALDITGNDRIRDIVNIGKSGANTIDRGAYEVQPPAACGPADVAPNFGVLDINDILVFAQRYNAQDPAADYFPEAAPNGVFDINDVLIFAMAFNAGCP